MSTTEANTAHYNTTTTTAMPLLRSTDSDTRQSLLTLLERATTRERNPDDRPPIVFELIWSSIIIATAMAVVLMVSKDEDPDVPLRLWIAGFGILRVLRMISSCVDYTADQDNTWHTHTGRPEPKCIQFIIWLLNLIWWVFGIYWLISGGEKLEDDAPKLFWFTVIFMTLDFLVCMFFVLVTCFICVAGFCCYPCIMSILSIFTQDSQQDAENGVVCRMARSLSRRISDTRESSNDPSSPAKHAVVSAENAV